MDSSEVNKLLTSLFAGSVVTLPERRLETILERLRERVSGPEEKPESLPLLQRPITRREMLKFSGVTVLAAFLAGKAAEPTDEALTILNTIQPEILQEVGNRLSRLMERPLLTEEPGTLKILASDGTVIGEQARFGFREWLPFDQIPEEYIKALICSEDASFPEHCGVDPRGLTRAAIKTLFQDEWQGGSTLTMQVVKLLTRQTTSVQTKVSEILTALAWEKALEQELGSKPAAKEFILEVYANIAPFVVNGLNVVGLKTAAEKIFGKLPKYLNPAEIAFLVGLPQNPVGHDPFTHFDKARRAQKAVLGSLVKNQILTQAQADEIFSQGIQLTPKELVQISTDSPYYSVCDQVLALLNQNLTEEKVKEGGEIITSIDPKLQSDLKTTIEEYLAGEIAQKYQAAQAVAVVMNTQTGEVLATYGNLRQDISPGSTVKPFTYTKAFEEGVYPNAQATVKDEPVQYQGQTFTNYDGTVSNQEVPLGRALRESLNTIALQTALKIGSVSLAEIFKRFGLIPQKNALSQITPASTLGPFLTTPLDLAAAYANLARGVRVKPSIISKIKSNISDEVNYSADPQASQQPNIDPQVAKEVLAMISDPNNLPHDADGKVSGDWQYLDIKNVAAKTGTSSNPFGGPKDVLIAGVTLSEDPEKLQYSVVVWLGPQEGKTLKEDTTALPVVGPLFKKIIEQLN